MRRVWVSVCGECFFVVDGLHDKSKPADRVSLLGSRRPNEDHRAMSETPFLRILADLFPSRERVRLAGVLGMGVVAALFEVLGVASILPFMTLMLDPSALERYSALRSIATSLGVATPEGALLLLGTAAVAIVALGNAFAALNLLVQERFGARTRIRLSDALFAGYLRQPYSFHVQRDAPSLIKVVIYDSYLVMGSIVQPALVGVSRGFLALSILTVLFLKDPVVTLVVTLVLGVSYWVIFRAVRRRQRRIGAELNLNNLERHRIAQESLGGVKELQALGRERYATERFAAATRSAALAEASNRVIAQLPRYALEAIAFGGILLTTLVLEAGARGGGAQTIVPVLALYAFAGYRLLPALQQIYMSAVVIRFNLPALRGLHEDSKLVNEAWRKSLDLSADEKHQLRFANAIRFEKVSFTYRDGAAPALRGVDLVIRPNESVGLVGRTGAGKTTLADMILGLYEPSDGCLTVDRVPLSGSAIRAWRHRVGYVPQHVFLANASVAENIALGLPPQEIDGDAVRRAARLAQADEFISGLPQGFETLVGERGVKLSGGQRQRLGIARALYHEPEVLVFDEATSALDGLTEDAVMDAIRSLSGQRTIILVAHRLRTVEACDRIVLLEEGRIIADGRYDDLLDTSQEFRRLVGQAHAVSVETVE
jgi:ABC-type multidrug transport system fused ATPase/permease subunit